MKENKKWESLVWIIIWILLLTFVILGLYNLIIYSENINITFEDSSVKWILKDNALNIVYKIHPNVWTAIGEPFYMYKNNTTKTFDFFTWATNIKYKYIDKYWELVSTGVTDVDIYERTFKLEVESVMGNIVPGVEINNYYKQ